MLHLNIYNIGKGSIKPLSTCELFDWPDPCTTKDCPWDIIQNCQHLTAGVDTCHWPDTDCNFCDSSTYGCDHDICNPTDTCSSTDVCYYKDCCTFKDYSSCVKRDHCYIDYGKCDGEDICDFDNECGPTDVRNQPVFP